MKNKKTNSRRRNFFAASLAAMMLTLTCGTAYADSNVDTSASETVELTDIGGYACYQRDGNYWTMLDGEEYLVIDLSALAGTPSDPASATSSITPLPLGKITNLFICQTMISIREKSTCLKVIFTVQCLKFLRSLPTAGLIYTQITLFLINIL